MFNTPQPISPFNIEIVLTRKLYTFNFNNLFALQRGHYSNVILYMQGYSMQQSGGADWHLFGKLKYPVFNCFKITFNFFI